jgi:hypothetical protein
MNITKDRKVKQSKYGEETEVIRVPKSMIPIVKEMLKKREILETQWQEKLIGPDAQKLVNLITELMITPQRGLIQALTDSGLPGFHDEIQKLNVELEVTRKACAGLTTTALLEVLQEPS